jgi:pilus assembly protein CpaB
MNKRFVGVLIFAAVVALAMSALLYRVLVNRPQQSAAVPAATTKIAVAAKDLDVGQVIKEDDVKLADWTGPVPDGSTNHPQELLGRGVITPIMSKEPVIEKRLAPKGAGGGFSVLIPPGLRAVPLRVNEVAGVAGFVVAGMHVDVLISGNSPGGDSRMGTVTKTLLQDVTVLSAGQDFKKDPEGKPVVVQVITVLATPEQAEILSLASAQTSVQLSLRNPLDKGIAKTPGTALARLFDGRLKFGAQMSSEGDPQPPRRAVRQAQVIPAALPVTRKEPAFVMEIISGTTKKEAKFETAGEGK